MNDTHNNVINNNNGFISNNEYMDKEKRKK